MRVVSTEKPPGIFGMRVLLPCRSPRPDQVVARQVHGIVYNHLEATAGVLPGKLLQAEVRQSLRQSSQQKEKVSPTMKTATTKSSKSAKLSEIEQIQAHAEAIRNGEHDKIGPGVPIAMSPALVPGEAIAQGDLLLVVAEKVPAGYKLVKNPTEQDRQLVPGNTVGAKHCLDSLAGVTMHRSPEWGPEQLEGPFLQLTQDRKILHPTHGEVTIPAGMSVHCRYDREFDAEQQRERRAAD